MTFRVTVYRVNESEHQASEESFEATGVKVGDDGTLQFQAEGGGRAYGATTWGGFKFERVPGSIGRA